MSRIRPREIKSVFVRADNGAGPRWDRVAKAKDREIANEMKRLEQRREVLARLATCTCPTVDRCGCAFIEVGRALALVSPHATGATNP